jgi:hypothetical protein
VYRGEASIALVALYLSASRHMKTNMQNVSKTDAGVQGNPKKRPIWQNIVVSH